MENDFDPDWPHGHVVGDFSARVVCTDVDGPYSIVAAVRGADGEERAFPFDKHGHSEWMAGLRNAPAPKRRITGWVNLYWTGMGEVHSTKDVADKFSSAGRLACIYIDVEEGEGL